MEFVIAALSSVGAAACDETTASYALPALVCLFLSVAYKQKHLLGTTYSNGVLPSRVLDVASRIVALCIIILATRRLTPAIVLRWLPLPRWLTLPLLAAYATTYVDHAEATGSAHQPAARYERKLSRLIAWALSHKARQCACVATTGAPLPADRQYLFGLHPHGTMPFGCLLNLGTSFTQRDGAIARDLPLKFGAATGCFYVPIMRELFLRWGVVDASRPIISRHIANGSSVALYIGGSAEAAHAKRAAADLVLRKRKGFVTLALEHGLSLVPVYTFGENSCIGIEPYNDGLGLGYGVAALTKLLLGLWLCPTYLPCGRQCECTTVVGAPIDVPRKGPDFSAADVEEVHARYVRALEKLYADNVGAFGGVGATREIRSVL